MPTSIECRRTSHPNIVVENLAASITFLEEVYGGSFMSDLPGPNWHACLIEVGGMIFELFEPKNFMLHGRIGPHYLGIEFEADMDQARAATAEHEVRILRDIVEAFHTDPATSQGIAFEYYGGTFYGPEARHIHVNHSRAPDYWAAQGVGFAGYRGYTHAVVDIEAASAFLQSYVSARPIYAAERPGLGARAIGLQIADSRCELVTPVADGLLRREMMTTGHGIRSTVFGVRDLAAARAWLEGKGLRVIAGTAPGAIMADPRDHLGFRFEFEQA
ncbi:VOC family protein [Novosphingobium bradum]|uniref:VOC family protein n=1 Tax=Novosphingobium bradum TaxID=1737444 RepID=A0ABV7IN12_9SPHN